MIEQQAITTIERPLLDRIRERGYWHVVIRPGQFKEGRVSPSALFPLLEERAVRFAVWPFPQVHLNGREYRSGDAWIEQQSAWDRYLEYWRFYQSGQLIDYGGMVEDWCDQSRVVPLDAGWQPGQELSLFSTIRHLAEIYELATRLVLAREYNDDGVMHIAITLQGLQGRQLIFDAPEHPPRAVGSRATVERFHHARDLLSIDLIARPRELALEATEQLFLLFDWGLPTNVLRGIQEQVAQ